MHATTNPGSVGDQLAPADLLAQLAGVDPSTSTVGECEASLKTIGRVRSYLDGVESQFTRRLRQMHDAGKAETAASIIAGAANTSGRDAQKKERRSEILDDADAFADGLETGAISGEHVDALANACAGLDDDVRSKVLDHQDGLVRSAQHKTPAQLAKELRDLIRLHEHDQGVTRDNQQRRDTYLNLKLDYHSGMYRLHGLLHPELGTIVNTTINTHVRQLIRNDKQRRDEPRGRLNAEALGELLSNSEPGSDIDGAGRPPTAQINVLIDYDTLIGKLHDAGVCETTDGASLPAWKVRQLACNNNILPIVMGSNSIPLDVGRAKRFFTRHQRAALRAIYATCAMPGCDVTFDRCEIHHLHPWENGGPTDLHNALPLCSHCHHLIHQPGWTTHLDNQRVLTITTPTGRQLTHRPGVNQSRVDEPRQDRHGNDNRAGAKRVGAPTGSQRSRPTPTTAQASDSGLGRAQPPPAGTSTFYRRTPPRTGRRGGSGKGVATGAGSDDDSASPDDNTILIQNVSEMPVQTDDHQQTALFQ